MLTRKNSEHQFFLITLVVNIVLVYLMREILTSIAIAAMLSSIVLNLFKSQTLAIWKWWRILIFLLNPWGIYKMYGLSLIPEASVNLLVGVVGLKYLENKGKRDLHIIFFCQVLIFFAGFLFLKDLDYFIFVLLGFSSLIFGLAKLEGVAMRVRTFWQTLLLGIPLFIVLFFAFPRWEHQMVPFQHNLYRPVNNQINLPEKLNFAQFSNLLPNQKENFIAWVPRKLTAPIYWRSHLFTTTDGWNWQQDPILPMQALEQIIEKQNIIKENKNLLNHTILFADTPKFYVGLDLPLTFKSSAEELFLKPEIAIASFPRRKMEKIYDVRSEPTPKNMNRLLVEKRLLLDHHLQREKIKSLLPFLHGEQLYNLQVATQVIKQFYLKESFKFDSNSSGKILSLEAFLQTKRGSFAHFASSTALILRLMRIPARLVVGYLGGHYNDLGGFYRLTSNHIHIWVEAWDEQFGFVRVDPMEWVAKDRLQNLDAFLMTEEEQISKFSALRYLKQIATLTPLIEWTQKLNAEFYFWMEEYNREKQKMLALDWKIQISDFYWIGLFFVCIFSTFFFWALQRWLRGLLYQKLSWSDWLALWHAFEKDFPQFDHQYSIARATQFLNNQPQAKKWIKKWRKIEQKYFI